MEYLPYAFRSVNKQIDTRHAHPEPNTEKYFFCHREATHRIDPRLLLYCFACCWSRYWTFCLSIPSFPFFTFVINDKVSPTFKHSRFMMDESTPLLGKRRQHTLIAVIGLIGMEVIFLTMCINTCGETTPSGFSDVCTIQSITQKDNAYYGIICIRRFCSSVPLLDGQKDKQSVPCNANDAYGAISLVERFFLL